MTEGIAVSWRCRAIFGRGVIDLVWDRQAGTGSREGLDALLKWVDKKGLKAMRRLVKERALTNDEDREVRFEDGGYVITANPRRSHGYLYLEARPC